MKTLWDSLVRGSAASAVGLILAIASACGGKEPDSPVQAGAQPSAVKLPGPGELWDGSGAPKDAVGHRWQETHTSLGDYTDSRSQIAVVSPDDQPGSAGTAVQVEAKDGRSVLVLNLPLIDKPMQIVFENGEMKSRSVHEKGTQPTPTPSCNSFRYAESEECLAAWGIPGTVCRLWDNNLAIAIETPGKGSRDRVPRATAARLVGPKRDYRLQGFIRGSQLVKAGLGTGAGLYPVPIYIPLGASGADPSRVFLAIGTSDFTPNGPKHLREARILLLDQFRRAIVPDALQSPSPVLSEAVRTADVAFFCRVLGTTERQEIADGIAMLMASPGRMDAGAQSLRVPPEVERELARVPGELVREEPGLKPTPEETEQLSRVHSAGDRVQGDNNNGIVSSGQRVPQIPLPEELRVIRRQDIESERYTWKKGGVSIVTPAAWQLVELPDGFRFSSQRGGPGRPEPERITVEVVPAAGMALGQASAKALDQRRKWTGFNITSSTTAQIGKREWVINRFTYEAMTETPSVSRECGLFCTLEGNTLYVVECDALQKRYAECEPCFQETVASFRVSKAAD